MILNLILDLTKKEDIKKTGRPPADIDWDVVDNFLKAHCDGVGIASFFGVHPNTLYRLVKEKYNISFDDYRRQKQAEGKELIRAKQYQTAMQGDKAMLIWLGKQLLDQKEKSDVTTNNESLNSQPKAILPDGTEIEI
ncbi:MAG: hypothetical protein BWX63_02306 [Bacteroidetes bacterium ADurb.Bin041]|nr:MAG: hypothetical protein BWX63_02306 [Bacteroidetes bacterium ADurb.Bin041]